MVERALAERLNHLASNECAESHTPAQNQGSNDAHTVSEIRQIIKNNLEALVHELGIAPFTVRTLARRLESMTELRIRDLRPEGKNRSFFTGTVSAALNLKDWVSSPFVRIPPQNSGAYTFRPELLQMYKPGLTLSVLSRPTEECKTSIETAGHHSTRAVKSLLIELVPALSSFYAQDEIPSAALSYIAARNTTLTLLDSQEMVSKNVTRFHARVVALLSDRSWAGNPFSKVRLGVYRLKAEALQHDRQAPESEKEPVATTPEGRILPEREHHVRHSASDVRRLIRANIKYIVRHLGDKPFFIKDFISLLAFYAELTPEDKQLVDSKSSQSRFYITAYACLKQQNWPETPIVQIAHGLYRLRPDLFIAYGTNQP